MANTGSPHVLPPPFPTEASFVSESGHVPFLNSLIQRELILSENMNFFVHMMSVTQSVIRANIQFISNQPWARAAFYRSILNTGGRTEVCVPTETLAWNGRVPTPFDVGILKYVVESLYFGSEVQIDYTGEGVLTGLTLKL